MEFNKYQSSLEELGIYNENQEIQDQFFDALNSIPYIRKLISPNRLYAKDIPKDNSGKIIVDITDPHIIEDTDYFRPSALYYKKHGCYTKLRPNPNPNSEFGKWIKEEVRRCFEGYVRESDGEWITGDMYFFLNYCPIQLTKKDKEGKDIRVIDFPNFWDGHYYKFHYLNQCRSKGKHAMELASRGKGKSYVGASLLAKRFILGESKDVIKKVQCVVTASEKKYIQGANQILDMFQYYIDFNANNTQFPSRRITSSLNDLKWTMGYIDVNTGTRKGSENSVIGITSKDDESKLRGSRGVLYLLEEAGSFPRLLNLYQVIRPSVEDGKAVWGMIYGYGTSGDSESDFSSMQELMYNPKGYNILGVKNIYDKEGQGRKLFTYFFPGYLNRADCYDSEGNSNVTKALLEIIKDRYTVKYNSSDINAITKRIAEIPLTPQEAIIRTKGNIFPVTDLSNRLNQLDNNPNEYNDVYTGSLVYGKDNQVEFMPTNDIPIREFPLKDNKAKGAVEIFKMPEKNSEGKVFQNRYILSFDPIDFDASNTMSLASIFVLDLWTDKIVAEYTGRQDFADDNYEILRRLCMFYNGKCLYENNLKGTFAYFSKMNCLYLLADTPEYLRDKDLIKSIGYGNLSKGVTATKVINDYANTLIRNWFLLPKPTVTEVDGEKVETEIYNLYFIRNRALLKEAILYNPDINVDRIRSLGLLMLFREQYMVIYNGDVQGSQQKVSKNHLSNDPFFTRNYDTRFKKTVNLI